MSFLITLSIFFLAVIIHEYAHGWIAWKLGDPTAKLAGRLTLNPIAHIDPVGTIFLPLVLLVTHSPVVFGWAKPVPVNFRSLNNPKKDMVWVGLAGPFANVVFAVFLSLLAKTSFFAENTFLLPLVNTAIVLNLVLAVFNMLPIPPLDGSRIAMGLLPRNLSIQYAKLEPYGFIIIFILLYFGMVGNLIWPLVLYISRMLGVMI